MSKHKDNVSIFFSPKNSGSIEDFFVTFSTTITCQEIIQLAVSSLLLARKLQGHCCLNSSFWKRTLNWAPPPVESALSTMFQKIEIPFGNYLLPSLNDNKLNIKLSHVVNSKMNLPWAEYTSPRPVRVDLLLPDDYSNFARLRNLYYLLSFTPVFTMKFKFGYNLLVQLPWSCVTTYYLVVNIDWIF